MPFAELGGVRLFYTDDGSGDPPLLLVHGWGADSQEWVWHLPHLAARYRVIAVDLRGHGYSSVPETGNTPRLMAADLAGLLTRLGTGPVVAVGHSMGGQVVSVLAVDHPELVRAVVCVDPAYGVTPEIAEPFPELVAALGTEFGPAAAVATDEWCYIPATPPMIRQWHTRRLLAMPPHVLAQGFAGMFTDPDQFGVRPVADAYLAQRDRPVLSFWFDPEQAAWEQGLLKDPRSKTVCWPGSGHRLHEERPAEFLHVLESWLAEVTS